VNRHVYTTLSNAIHDMAAASPPIDPKPDLERLLSEARRLRDEYEAAFQRYKTDGQVNRLIGHFGVEAAYEYYGIPKGISRDALSGFLRGWEASEPYRQLRQRFETLLDIVSRFLQGVSETVPSLRPPGNSAKLVAKLGQVRTAVRLDTKMRNLTRVLEDIDTRPLVRNQDIPAPRPRPRPPAAGSRPRQSAPADSALAWTLVGVILGVFLALALGLFTLIGWGSTIAASLATIALIVTRHLWVGPVARLGSPKRKGK